MGYSPWGCKKLDTTERLALQVKKYVQDASVCVKYIYICVCVCVYIYICLYAHKITVEGHTRKRPVSLSSGGKPVTGLRRERLIFRHYKEVFIFLIW